MDDDAASPRHKRQSVEREPGRPGRLVLVADGDVMSGQDAARRLREAGWTVVLVRSGTDAVQRFSAGIGVVLLAAQLEDGRGEDSARRLRALPGSGDTPILQLAEAETLTEPDPVFDGLLETPVQPEALDRLLAAIGDVLAANRAADATGCGSGLQPLDQPLPLIDLERWQEQATMLGEAAMARLLAEFLERLPGDVADILRAAAGRRLQDVDNGAHRLKGAALMVGFPRLAAIAHCLRAAAAEGRRDEAALTALPACLRETLAAVADLS